MISEVGRTHLDPARMCEAKSIGYRDEIRLRYFGERKGASGHFVFGIQ